MANLSIKSLYKKFGNTLVVNNINLDVADQEFVVLLGPSGCGKSTVLRMIAGLEKPTSGFIELDGEIINQLPPQQRDMAMVFQNYALYAHLSVFDNMAFSLKMRKIPKETIKQLVFEVACLLQIEKLLDRKPRQLSGGERQRVALGRAIVRKPRLFLMDEPLSNLDALLRIQMRTEILKLSQNIGATVVYVTHDQTEAMTMGDRVVVLRHGELQQADTPLNIYNRPANRFVAEFVGSPPINFIDGISLYCEDDLIWAKTSEFFVKIGDRHFYPWINKLSSQVLENIEIGIRPENLTIVSTEDRFPSIPGIVEVLEPLGRETLVYVNIGNQSIRVFTSPSENLQKGERVHISLSLNKANLFDRKTGKNLGLLV